MKILRGLKVPVMTLNRAPSHLVTWVMTPLTEVAVKMKLIRASSPLKMPAGLCGALASCGPSKNQSSQPTVFPLCALTAAAARGKVRLFGAVPGWEGPGLRDGAGVGMLAFR